MELGKRQMRNRGAGLALIVVAVLVFIVYVYLLFFSSWSMVVVQATILGAIGILLLVLGWIGYTMLTAPKAPEATK
ncbi:MAG: transcriptional regulator [Nitrososphaera sp.]|jgi:protein-S-isoprenylcysteine O-methyltransferase Ste14